MTSSSRDNAAGNVLVPAMTGELGWSSASWGVGGRALVLATGSA